METITCNNCSYVVNVKMFRTIDRHGLVCYTEKYCLPESGAQVRYCPGCGAPLVSSEEIEKVAVAA